MLVSYKWLQEYFDAQLPGPDELTQKLMFGAFEVDSVTRRGDDTILDVKVLPNRGHDCLSHRGIARELSGLLDIPMKNDPLREATPEFSQSGGVSVNVEDLSRCPLYAAALVEGVKVAPSPQWLKERIEAIGQRSINNIVDATNFVMFDLGTPLHAFDADKLGGKVAVGVRAARAGEKMQILGGENMVLTESESVIVDSADSPIAVAGVKGGAKAELNDNTKNILIEAAKFHPATTRKAAQRLNLRTDASKRFENEIADDLPLYGLKAVVELIVKVAGGKLTDAAVSRIGLRAPYKVGVSAGEVNRILGTNLSEDDAGQMLARAGLQYEVVDPIKTVLSIAPTLVGAEYKGDSAIQFDAPRIFSCSSFTNYLFVQGGVAMPSISIDQYAWCAPIETGDLQAGDLVFSNSGKGRIRYETVQYAPGTKVPEGVDHVGLYLGGGDIIHATKDPGKVLIEKLDASPSFRNIVGYRRVVLNSERRFVVTAPFERLDLRRPADLIEEIGRMWGYDKIGELALPDSKLPTPSSLYYFSDALRAGLSSAGFVEVYTYSLCENGKVRLANSLASDKSALREALLPGLSEAMIRNERNSPLLGVDHVRIFEIGVVFPDAKTEEVHLAIAAGGGKVGKKAIEEARSIVEGVLGKVKFSADGDVIECDIGAHIAKLQAPAPYPEAPSVAPHASYKSFSQYPFALRDIALWVSNDSTATDVANVIREKAGSDLVRLDLFDEYKKDDQTSFAFHLVFQSMERTLTDEEVNGYMKSVELAAQEKGWKVR